MKTFDLVKRDSVLIYGAGAFGKDIYYKIKDIYDVIGFIDKNAKDIRSIDIPVYDPVNISKYKGSIVIVCVHNANWHYEIVQNLYAQGFEHIIFLAVSDRYSRKKAFEMNQIYNLFLEEQYDSLQGIPCYTMMLRNNIEERIIRENENYVVVWCRKELIYSNDRVNEHERGKVTEENIEYLDVPMITLKPYISLFRYFMYGRGNADLYIRSMKRLNNSFIMSDDDFLQDQYNIYQLLEKEYENGNNSFSNAPIVVEWNSRGYFNIIDGHHRCAFYLLKGLQNLPIRMKRRDYDLWVNSFGLGEVEHIIEKKHVIPAIKINHPILWGYKSNYKEYETTVLETLQEWLFETKQKFKNVLEISQYQAYYGRNFYRMQKADKTVAVVKKEEMEFANSLCKLFYVPDENVEVVESLEKAAAIGYRYEMGLVLNMYDIEELKQKIGYLNQCITNTIFWQSKSNIEEEKKCILEHSTFDCYKRLAKKCYNGKLCEIGVFFKNGKC